MSTKIQSGNNTAGLQNVDALYNSQVVVKNLPSAPVLIDFPSRSSTVDSFGRIRTSEPRLKFEYIFSSGIRLDTWDAQVLGAGTFLPVTTAVGANVAAVPNSDASTNLNTTLASSTGAWIQAIQHTRYTAGISTIFHVTFNIGSIQANQTVRVGAFTDQGTFPSNAGDGLYFEVVGSTINFNRRFLTSGGVGSVETVPQSGWNLDKMDGTGLSGINLDFTKVQHLVIEHQWHGVSSVRIGFLTGNGTIFCHTFTNINVSNLPWSRTGSLPIRAEIFTTGAVAQIGILKLFGCSVLQEGDVEFKSPVYRTANSGVAAKTTGIVAGTYLPILAIRNNVVNDYTKRSEVVPMNLAIVNTGVTLARWALILAPTVMTGATFTALTTNAVQVDIAATVITGGIEIASGIIPSTTGYVDIDLSPYKDNLLKIGQNALGNLTTIGATVLCLAVAPLSTTAAVVNATITWRENL